MRKEEEKVQKHCAGGIPDTGAEHQREAEMSPHVLLILSLLPRVCQGHSSSSEGDMKNTPGHCSYSLCDVVLTLSTC